MSVGLTMTWVWECPFCNVPNKRVRDWWHCPCCYTTWPTELGRKRRDPRPRIPEPRTGHLPGCALASRGG